MEFFLDLSIKITIARQQKASYIFSFSSRKSRLLGETDDYNKLKSTLSLFLRSGKLISSNLIN
jgi:hypothetical protein